MMHGMMGGSMETMMWGMGLFGLLGLLIAILIVAALVKYVFSADQRSSKVNSLHPNRRGLLAGLAAAALVSSARAAATLPQVAVTKDPSCGCCDAWVVHLRKEGFPVEVTEGPVNRLKTRLGVPRELASCHTAQVGGYVIEGHVPASAIRRLLAQKPRATGLAVPGMPVGSPAMEVEGIAPETYEVVLFGPGEKRVFERFQGVEKV
jgi:hypothetical protein